MAQDRKLTLP